MRLSACLCAFVHLSMSGGADVFSCTAAVCNSSPAWWLWGTPQMFRCFSLENKQNRECFFQGRGTVKTRAGAPLDPSHPQTRLRSVLSHLVYVLYSMWFQRRCVFCVCRLPVIVLECRCGALWMMNWRKSSEHSPILLTFTCDLYPAPHWVDPGSPGPCRAPGEDLGETGMKWKESKTWRGKSRLLWLLFACCVPDVCLTVS